MNQSLTINRGKHHPQKFNFGQEGKNMKIMTFNSSGLRNKKKRSSIFRLFKKEKMDIIALQETYLLENDKQIIECEWGGKIFIGQGTVRSMGQMILISKQISNTFQINELHNDCRLLIIEIKGKNGEGMVVVNLYAPNNEQDREVYFQKAVNNIEMI